MSGQDERAGDIMVGQVVFVPSLRRVGLVRQFLADGRYQLQLLDHYGERAAYIDLHHESFVVGAGLGDADAIAARVRAEERARYGAVVEAITHRRHAEEGPLVLLALREMHDRACIAFDWAPDHETPWRRVANQLRAALAALGEGER